METKLKKLVLEGFYHEAENVMLTIPLNAQRDIIMNLAYDTESIAIYGFLRYNYQVLFLLFLLPLLLLLFPQPVFLEYREKKSLFP